MPADRDDREKLSFAERDKRRREKDAGHGTPRGGPAKALSERHMRDALKAADALFAAEPGGDEGEALTRAVRDAHGSPDLAAACHAYTNAFGVPTATDLLSIFLDAGDDALTLPALERLESLASKGRLELSQGLRRQLRALTDDPDDDIAGIAEELLE